MRARMHAHLTHACNLDEAGGEIHAWIRGRSWSSGDMQHIIGRSRGRLTRSKLLSTSHWLSHRSTTTFTVKYFERAVHCQHSHQKQAHAPHLLGLRSCQAYLSACDTDPFCHCLWCSLDTQADKWCVTLSACSSRLGCWSNKRDSDKLLRTRASIVTALTDNSADLGLACTVAAVLLCDIEVRLAERLQLPQERPHAMMAMMSMRGIDV
jgi:hypothetical protein